MSRIVDAERTRNISYIDNDKLVLIQEKMNKDSIATSYIYGNTRLVENRDSYGRLQNYSVSIGERSANSPDSLSSDTEDNRKSLALYAEAKKQIDEIKDNLYLPITMIENRGYERVKSRDQISAMINGNYCTYFYYHTDQQDLLQASYNADNYEGEKIIAEHPVLSVLNDLHYDKIRLCDLEHAIDDKSRTK